VGRDNYECQNETAGIQNRIPCRRLESRLPVACVNFGCHGGSVPQNLLAAGTRAARIEESTLYQAKATDNYDKNSSCRRAGDGLGSRRVKNNAPDEQPCEVDPRFCSSRIQQFRNGARGGILHLSGRLRAQAATALSKCDTA